MVALCHASHFAAEKNVVMYFILVFFLCQIGEWDIDRDFAFIILRVFLKFIFLQL